MRHFFFKLLFLANPVMHYLSLFPVCLPEHTLIAMILSGLSYRCGVWFLSLREDHKLQFTNTVFRNFRSCALRERWHAHGVMYQKISDFFGYKFYKTLRYFNYGPQEWHLVFDRQVLTFRRSLLPLSSEKEVSIYIYQIIGRPSQKTEKLLT